METSVKICFPPPWYPVVRVHMLHLIINSNLNRFRSGKVLEAKRGTFTRQKEALNSVHFSCFPFAANHLYRSIFIACHLEQWLCLVQINESLKLFITQPVNFCL